MKQGTMAMAALLLGSIGGVQIWAAAGMSAGIGLASILVWLAAAGIMAMVALYLLRCASFYSRVAGGYAYVKAAYGHFYGFFAGWSTIWAEAITLGILAVLASKMIGTLVQLPVVADIGIKAGFIVIIVILTLLDARVTSRWWSAAKLVMLFVFLGIGAIFVASNPSALALGWTGGWLGVLPALAIAIWAFGGFEIASMPSKITDDIRLPVAIAFGIAVIIFICFSTFVQVAAGNSALPIVSAATGIPAALGLGLAGIAFIVAAALVAFLSPSAARTPHVCLLSKAMVADGMLPPMVGRHERNDVLLVPLIAQAVIAFIASLFNDVGGLIFFAFVLLALSLASTSIAYGRLRRYYLRKPYEKFSPDYSVVLVVAILAVTVTQIPIEPLLIAVMVILLGIPFYIHFAPKTENAVMKEKITSEIFIEKACGVARRAYLGSLLERRTK